MLKKDLNFNPFELRNLSYPGHDIPQDEDVGIPGQPAGCEGQVAWSGHSWTLSGCGDREHYCILYLKQMLIHFTQKKQLIKIKMQNQIQPTRRRIVWSDVEVEILVATFKKNDKPTRSEIAVLIGVLEPGRTEKQVRNWFMNQRSKAKKMKRDKEAFLSQGNLSNISTPPTQLPPPKSSSTLLSPISPTLILKNDLEWPVLPDLGNPFTDLNLLAYQQSCFQPIPYFYNVQLNGYGKH